MNGRVVPRRARTVGPVCGRDVSVGRSSEEIHRHYVDGVLCRGVGQQVDMYGSGPVQEVEG